MPLASEHFQPGAVGIVFFFLFIIGALSIAYWAARRTRTTEPFCLPVIACPAA